MTEGRGDAALRVRVIDGFSVEGLNERELGGRKPRTALRLLALADGRPVTADMLWLDAQPRDPAAQLAAIMSGCAGSSAPRDWWRISAIPRHRARGNGSSDTRAYIFVP